VSQERISAELKCPAIESGMRNVKVAIVKCDTISVSSVVFGPESLRRARVGELLMMEELVIKAFAHIVGEELARLDLWWYRTFGHSLSGRMNKLEIQTLFHGNTEDQDQI
jgi:hypothetical protein